MTSITTPKYASHWTRILGACHARAGTCPIEGASGAVLVSADGPSAAAVDAVTGYGTMKYAPGGAVVSQASSPVIFLDQASVRWSAVFSETPRSQQSQLGAIVTSFAVMNLSRDAQEVTVRIYDERGNLTFTGKTPVLAAGTPYPTSGDAPVGGIYSETLANFLGTELRASVCANGPFPAGPLQPPNTSCTSAPQFRGTLVLEGEKGLIAPVVFRMSGVALATVPVRAE